MAEDEFRLVATVESITEASEFLQCTMVEAGALAVDESVPREMRLELALGLVRLRDQLRRMAPEIVESMILLAYGDPGPYQTDPVPPEIRAEAAQELVDRALVTRAELDAIPKETLIARVRERLAGQGFVDDTGIAG